VRRNEVRTRLAGAVSDGKLAAALRLAAGEQELLPGGRPGEALLAQLKSAWAADPDDEALSLMLERALLKSQDGRGLVDLYRHRLTLTAGATDQAQLFLRIADAFETLLGDATQAAAAYESAADVSPGLYPALRGLARSYRALGNPEKARQTLVQLAKAAKDQATAVEALMEAANLAMDAGQKDVAAGIYREVLEREPLHPEAGPALEGILAAKGGAADLAALHERRAQARLASKDVASATTELFSAANLYARTLNDANSALTTLDRLLGLDPNHLDALTLKGELAFASERWPDAAQAFGARVQLGGDASQLAVLHLKLGALHQDRLGDAPPPTCRRCWPATPTRPRRSSASGCCSPSPRTGRARPTRSSGCWPSRPSRRCAPATS
jgi:tetratricopeptide (TPR) repeat protein